MIRSIASARRRPVHPAALLALPLVFAACGEGVTGAGSPVDPPRERSVVGVLEVTISGLTTPEAMAASARSVALAGAASAGLQPSLIPVEEGGRTGIQLEPLSTGSFTLGERGAGGQRYLSATFRVRNADSDGIAYTEAVENLTFLAVATAGTLDETAVSQLRLFDGSDASPSLALGLLPTGSAHLVGGDLVASEPDVLQLFTEAEVAGVAAPDGIASVFPYGFVARNVDGGRTLPASPAAGQFDGVVTFAFRLPLEATAAEDPFEISVLVLATADDVTRLTQSPEEQTAAGLSAIEERVSTLGATMVTRVPPVPLDIRFAGSADSRWLCTVRTAGTAGAPSAHLVDELKTFLSLAPDPHAPDGTASFISAASSFEATFAEAVTGASSATFPVHGSQSGRAFVRGRYGGNGTPTITTPVASFFPGEEIEVVVTRGWVCEGPAVARYRVASAPAGADFTQPVASPFDVGFGPRSVAIGELNGDGDLDLAVANEGPDNVSILLGNGDGTFQAQQTFAVGEHPWSVAMGDLNGDGNLDLAVANSGPSSNDVSVLLGNGDGTFQTQQTFATGAKPRAVAIGDLNGSGALDLAVVNQDSDDVSILVSNGDGTFEAQEAFAVGVDPLSVAIGDLNGDLVLDVAVANGSTGNVSVLLGEGDGRFQAQQTFTAGAGPFSVATGDLNGDGDLDLAVANSSGNDVAVLVGNGDGTFQARQTFAAGTRPTSVAIGDLTGDGVLDLAVGNGDSYNVSILVGNGDGTFQAQQTFAVGSDPGAFLGDQPVAIGDLTGDGRLDLAVGSFRQHQLFVLLNSAP